MYPIEINTWYNCIPDKSTGNVELCKIWKPAGSGLWQVCTYYDGRDLFTGTLNDCLHWINNHYTRDRRYFN